MGQCLAWVGVGSVLLAAACSDAPPPGLEGAYGFSAVVFVQRPHRTNSGSLVDEDEAFEAGRLVMLEPAAPSGRLRPLIDLPAADINGLDVLPDGRRLVAAVRTDPADFYHLVLLDLDAFESGSVCYGPDSDLGAACSLLTYGPADDTRPVVLPDGRIAFARADPDGPMDFQGRGPARRLWAVEPDGSAAVLLDHGTGHVLGVSQLTDGWLRGVRWAERASGAVFLPTRIDPSSSRGTEPDGAQTTTSGLPLRVARDAQGRQYAACIPSLGTWAAGTVCQKSPKDDLYQGIVSSIPDGSGCSPDGRVADAVVLGDWQFLVSYAKVPNGCMNITDDDQGKAPDFGIALLDARTSQRLPVYNDPEFDELQVQPIRPRALLDPGVFLPARPELACDLRSVRFEGFVDPEQLAAGAVGVRLLQARSGIDVPWAVELGGSSPGSICRDAAGQQLTAPIQADGSFGLDAPADASLRLQVVDRYGAALATDPFWRGGPACAQRRCAGCHANDAQAVGFEGSLAALAGPVDLAADADAQLDFDFDRDIQPILTRSCAVSGCHDTTTAAGNYVDLSGGLRGLDLHAEPSGRTSVAYQNLLFVDQARAANTGLIIDQARPWVVPGQARASRLIQKLGVPCRDDCAAAPAWAPWGMPADTRHPEDQPAFAGELSDADRWLLVEWIDAGAVFHGRGATP